MTPIAVPDMPVLIIDDMYSDVELASIWEELQFLTSPKRMLSARETEAATYEDGRYKKTANGVFLDSFYTDRNYSNILEVNRKLFTKEVIEYALKLSIFYGLLKEINVDYTLINYYDRKQSYEAHTDVTVFTAITTFYKEPAKFTGGDLEFPELGLKVEKRNNRMVMFPGSLQHAITPVEMQSGYPNFSGYGRYGMAQFLIIK
jgi:predicted 2-oxoglutarate/Fe(II)-dependent dioxygenase YbiX